MHAAVRNGPTHFDEPTHIQTSHRPPLGRARRAIADAAAVTLYRLCVARRPGDVSQSVGGDSREIGGL
jgi:hypothetical protein